MELEGAQKICAKPVKKKDPMVTETIKLLIDAHNLLDASLHDLRFLTVVVLCFAGFMRIDELLTTQLMHITIKDRHM